MQQKIWLVVTIVVLLINLVSQGVRSQAYSPPLQSTINLISPPFQGGLGGLTPQENIETIALDQRRHHLLKQLIPDKPRRIRPMATTQQN